MATLTNTDMVSERTTCRVCGSRDLLPYFDLGDQPLANALRDPADSTPEARIPLCIQACLSCGLSQLTHVVDPTTLFGRYVFWSGANPAWYGHCASLCDMLEPLGGKFVLEIASNDGTFLKEADRRGAITLGVEPAADFLTCGYPIVYDFWSTATAARPAIRGKVDVLVASNVLGHVDDAHDFVKAVELALAPDGIAIIEIPHIIELLRRNAFDTIYHEHVSYWGAFSLARLFAQHGLTLRDAQSIDVHGGSLRLIVGRGGPIEPSIQTQCRREHYQCRRRHYEAFAERCRAIIMRLNSMLEAEQPYHGYGAAAKATVLLNALKPSARPGVVYDDSPHKQGKLVPGTDIRIVAPTGLSQWVGTLAIFPHNWATQIMARVRGMGFIGRFVVPLEGA